MPMGKSLNRSVRAEANMPNKSPVISYSSGELAESSGNNNRRKDLVLHTQHP